MSEPNAPIPEPARHLQGLCREIHLLEGAADLLAWDQEVLMPSRAIDHRADQLALLARLQHERLTSPAFADALEEAAEAASPDDPEQTWSANVRELRRRHRRASAVPSDLVERTASVQSRAQAAWAQARERSEFALFAPWLEQVFALAREKASCLRAGSADPEWVEDWDALADGFEPGITAARLAPLFAELAPRLSALVERVASAPRPAAAALRDHPVDVDAQERFVRHVAHRLGFDPARGRIDRSTHPFCSGTHPDDVRMTTRFRPADLLDGLGSTMHETGHALYELGLPREHAGTPCGQAAGLALHESQSRLWENHVGRGEAFWAWARDEADRLLGPAALAGYDARAVFEAANVVRPSLIRVEADEVTYDLHVLLRFDLERALVRGDLAVSDLPAAWNDGMQRLLGIEVPDDARGCLQDVHWSCGLVGYFPTYTLGNLWAAELYAEARRRLPGLEDDLARGNFAPLRAWLGENVHRHGSRSRGNQRVATVLGREPDAETMLDHLTARVEAVYG